MTSFPQIRFTQWKWPSPVPLLDRDWDYDFEYEREVVHSIQDGSWAYPHLLWVDNGVRHFAGERDETGKLEAAERFAEESERIHSLYLTEEDVMLRRKRRLELKGVFDARVKETLERIEKERHELKEYLAKQAQMRKAEADERAAEYARTLAEYEAKIKEKKARDEEQAKLWREEEARREAEAEARWEQLAKEREAHAERLREKHDAERKIILRHRAEPQPTEVDLILGNKWQCIGCKSTKVEIRHESGTYTLKCKACQAIARGSHETLINIIWRDRGFK